MQREALLSLIRCQNLPLPFTSLPVPVVAVCTPVGVVLTVAVDGEDLVVAVVDTVGGVVVLPSEVCPGLCCKVLISMALPLPIGPPPGLPLPSAILTVDVNFSNLSLLDQPSFPKNQNGVHTAPRWPPRLSRKRTSTPIKSKLGKK